MLAVATPASAAYSTAPIGLRGWHPDGPVHAVLASGARVFVGGYFTGGVVALDARTGALLWTGSTNDGVRALALSSDHTHLLVGGAFTLVRGDKHRKIASLRTSNGTPDPAWRTSVGGMVRDIAVNGDVAYFGGTFKRHDGIRQGGLGAASVLTGDPVRGFKASTNGTVNALATNGSQLVVAGDFTQVNRRPRNSLAAISLTRHRLRPWNPARPCSSCNVYWDMLLAGHVVYAVGRNGGAVVAIGLPKGVRRWRVIANGDAQTLTKLRNRLYVGGHFSHIGPQGRPSRKLVASLNAKTGGVGRFSPTFRTAYPGVWALDATRTRLYAGGYFTGAGKKRPERFPYFAMFGQKAR